MLYLGLLALGVALGLPIAVIGAGLGQGKAAAAALEGVARQPEAAGKIQTMMIIALALIESLVIYALLMFFMLQGKLPTLTVADLAGLK
ncbi:MAG: ATP synthase F0 subunit C [Armatimonadaceae bacterium]|jgi:F-type H+-transporting ATPase subunit c